MACSTAQTASSAQPLPALVTNTLFFNRGLAGWLAGRSCRVVFLFAGGAAVGRQQYWLCVYPCILCFEACVCAVLAQQHLQRCVLFEVRQDTRVGQARPGVGAFKADLNCVCSLILQLPWGQRVGSESQCFQGGNDMPRGFARNGVQLCRGLPIQLMFM